MTDPIEHDPEPRKPILVYFLAAPEDETVCKDIHKFLKPIVENSVLRIFVDSDFDIPPGSVIDDHKLRLLEADIVLAIISVDYINDDNIDQRNLKVLERYNNRETILIPILARNCLWKSTPFGGMNPLPKTLKPLNNWKPKDDGFTMVAQELSDSIDEFIQKKASQPRPIKANGSDANPKNPSEKSGIEAETVTQINPDWKKKYYLGVLLKRGVALGLDYIFLAALPFGILWFIGWCLGDDLNQPDGFFDEFVRFLLQDKWGNALIGAVSFYLVAPWMESSQWRGTIGKRILNLQITDREGKPISFFRALWRNFIRSLVVFYYCLLFPLIIQYFRIGNGKTIKLFHDEFSNTEIGERLDAAQQTREAAKKEEQQPRRRVAEQSISGSEVSGGSAYTSKSTIPLEPLMNWLKSAWSWLSKPNPKKTPAFIGGALAIGIGGLWQAYPHFSENPKLTTSASTNPGLNSGIAVGGNVSPAVSTGEIAVVTTGNVILSITIEPIIAGLNPNETRVKFRYTENADKAKAENQLYQSPYSHNNVYPAAYPDFVSALGLQPDISLPLLGMGKVIIPPVAGPETSLPGSPDTPEQSPEHPDIAQNLSNRAEQYWKQGEYAKAKQHYLQSLKIREKALGPDHPDVAVSLNNIAEIYWAQLKYAKAEPLYRRSLRILEKVFGPDNLKVAQSYNNLAKLYLAQGKYAKAEQFLKRSVKIREEAIGPDNPQAKTSHKNYTALLEVEAEAMKTRAKAIQAKHK